MPSNSVYDTGKHGSYEVGNSRQTPGGMFICNQTVEIDPAIAFAEAERSHRLGQSNAPIPSLAVEVCRASGAFSITTISATPDAGGAGSMKLMRNPIGTEYAIALSADVVDLSSAGSQALNLASDAVIEAGDALFLAQSGEDVPSGKVEVAFQLVRA